MIETFQIEKQRIIEKLSCLQDKLLAIEKYDIDVSSLIEKVNDALQNLKNEKFIIAMFGAFTDGKSTILSALTKRSDIKIAPDPTTDEITVYELENKSNDDFLIVDTPGLFSDNMMHSERTIKFISEANVVIYTVDPVNPLKESHHATVKWLLEDLGKTHSTIFVVNKMDEVADLEDTEDFQHNSRIKQKVVIDTLKNICSLKQIPKVICVAADPYGMGLEHWFQNEDDYLKLSRIELLATELENFIQQSKKELINNAGLSVIKDALSQSVKQLETVRDELQKQVEINANQIKEIENNIRKFERDINAKHRNIKEEILAIQEDLLSAIKSVKDVGDLRHIIQVKIGKDGYILNENINLIVQKYTDSLFDKQQSILKSIESSLEFYSDIQKKLIKLSGQAGAKIGQKIASQSAKTLSETILKVRDFTKLPIKFKPWQAIKWGKAVAKFGKFLQTFPILLESVSVITDIMEENKLRKERETVENQITALFQEFITSFTKESYVQTYFPIVGTDKEILENLQNLQDTNKEMLADIETIIQELQKQKFEL
jgi:small GTP-binding protein